MGGARARGLPPRLLYRLRADEHGARNARPIRVRAPWSAAKPAMNLERTGKFWLMVAGPLALPIGAAMMVVALSSLGEYAARWPGDFGYVHADGAPRPGSRVNDADRDGRQRDNATASSPTAAGIGAASKRACERAAAIASISRTVKTSSAFVRPRT